MRRHGLALLGYLVLTLICTYPLALNFASAIPGDGFDGLQNYWNLWWVRRALLDLQTTPFFTRELFYPTGASLYFHTLNIFNGLWSLPIQSLTNLAVTYNAIVLCTFVLSGYGTFLLAGYVLQGLGGRERARQTFSALITHRSSFCFIAGFIFAFAPFRFAHLLGHMQVLSTEWIPFFVLTYLQMRERTGAWWRRAFLPAFFLMLNALCDWYYVLYLLIFCGALWLWQLAWRPPTTDRRPLPALRHLASAAGGLLAVSIIFAILVSPLLMPMLREASSAAYLRPPFDETVMLSADLLAFVTPSEFHPWWGEAARAVAEQFTSSASERTVFAGFTVLALAAVGVWRERPTARIWLLNLSAFFLLSLGPYLHVFGQVVAPVPLPYAWLYALVPLVRITRSVSRFDVIVMLALAVLAALGLTALHARPRLIALCAALIAVEFLAIPYPLTRLDVPPFYARLARERGDFAILELPINWDRPDPLLYQTVHARPLITAYTSRTNPLSIVGRTPILNELRALQPDIIVYDTRAIAPSVFADLDVRYVINHPLTMGEGDERTMTNRVLQQMFGSQQPVVNEPNLVAYRVPPPDPYRPYLALGDGWGEVQIVNGRPQRAITSRADFVLHARTADSIPLHIIARTAGEAYVVVSTWRTPDFQIEAGEFDLFGYTATEVMVSSTARYTIETSAPIVVESLELQTR